MRVTRITPEPITRLRAFKSVAQAERFYALRRKGYGHRVAAIAAGVGFYEVKGL